MSTFSLVTRTTINVKTSIDGIHHYPDAPEQVSFLRDPHRHLFNIMVCCDVNHNNREVEFFMLKRVIDKHLHSMGTRWYDQCDPPIINFGPSSCEDIAKTLLFTLRGEGYNIRVVCVQEDDENSATVSIQ